MLGGHRQVASAGPAGQALNLMPLFGAALASLLLGEPLHGYHFTGMALVLLGIGMVALGVRRGPVEPTTK